MNMKYIIGAVIIAVFLVWGATAFLQTTIQYVAIEDAANTERTVQVMGKIDFDLVNYDSDRERLEFAIYDTEATDEVNAPRLAVHYYGVVPGNFDQAESVVLKGKTDGEGVFVADQMLVKCPSKYQGEGNEYQDMETHNEAVDAAAAGV